MLRPLLPLVLSLGTFPALAQEPTSLLSKISEVTVYPSSARVVRIAEGPLNDGTYVLSGLPASLDPRSVRVRCVGGYVVGVEVRERTEDRSPEARLEELRLARRKLTREEEAGRDEFTVLEQRAAHLRSLLALSASSQREAAAKGVVDVDSWRTRGNFITKGLRDNARAKRELGWKLEDLKAELAVIEQERTKHREGSSVQLRDVVVKLANSVGARALEVAYLVEGARWTPHYDIRAETSGKRVRLGYRGEIAQSTGEDWTDVRLLLSSAEPKRSARGPELEQRWAWLYDPSPAVGAYSRQAARTADVAPEEPVLLDALGYSGGMDEDGYAEVLEEGLSVRFVVPGTDSVKSGGGTTTVQVGEIDLVVRPEYYCVPRQDTTVWLRGYAKNVGRWPILAGPAAVFFGDDFLGHARLPQTEVGQEFTIPLGAADAISCERIKTRDFAEGPSFFGSSAKDTEGWRLTFANNGGAIHAADGSVRVTVREALPRSTDDRVEVKLEDLSHPTSRAERWKKDAEELGFQTWELQIPLGKKVDLRYSIAVTFPKKSGVSYR